MNFGNQFAKWLLAVGLAAGMAYPCVAQNSRGQVVRQQAPKPPKPQSAPRQQHPAGNQNHGNANRLPNAPANRPQGNAGGERRGNPSGNQNHGNANRPANANPNGARAPQYPNRPGGNAGGERRGNPNGNLTPRQQLGVGAARPWVDRMRDSSPAQRESVLRNSRAFQNMPPQQQNNIRRQFQQWDRMSPQQRADQRTKEDTWRHMTPEQREHIKYDVLPKWRQLPPERQGAIQRRLGVLQNMPESARNQRLNDPNFTKGMSDEDKATLRDLSHLHVGGAPDPPGE